MLRRHGGIRLAHGKRRRAPAFLPRLGAAPTVFGELAIETYYTFGPPVAGVVGESELLRATARAALRPVIEKVRAR